MADRGSDPLLFASSTSMSYSPVNRGVSNIKVWVKKAYLRLVVVAPFNLEGMETTAKKGLAPIHSIVVEARHVLLLIEKKRPLRLGLKWVTYF